MIEIIEEYHKDRLVAYTVGGSRTVVIIEKPAETVTEVYNPSMGASYRAGQPRSKEVTVSRRFQVIHPKGMDIATSYDKAIKLAVKYAR